MILKFNENVPVKESICDVCGKTSKNPKSYMDFIHCCNNKECQQKLAKTLKKDIIRDRLIKLK